MASNIIAIATAATAWALGFVGNLPERLQYPFTRHVNTTISRELASQLSPQAQIHYPGSNGFDLATDRWITWKNPHLDIVVEVTTEDDVANTIRFANANHRPFIAISGQHGANTALADIRNGIGIWMRSMRDINIADDGLSATFGGGIKSKKLLHSLWDDGKMTVVGCCECTGAAAAMLGGGHGWLQGRHGLMADNLISARAVLANGSAITVSNDEHSDLFWGLRGAGHNFAILTSFESKIYDRTPENENWVVDTMIFTADKFDDVHNQANRLVEGSQPVELIHMILWSTIPGIDPDRPIILSILVYQGKEIPQKHLGPFMALEPVVHDSVVTDLPGVAPVVQFSDLDPACQHGDTLLRFPVNLESYNLDGLRRAFAIFSNVSTPFKGSMMILEAYSTHGVQAVAEETTAYPDRKNKLLLSPFVWYTPDESLDDQAAEYGRQIRDALVDASGKPLHAYVNYAYGDESQEALYGYEPWRLEKLRKLKETYDPHGRFGYYNPI